MLVIFRVKKSFKLIRAYVRKYVFWYEVLFGIDGLLLYYVNVFDC